MEDVWDKYFDFVGQNVRARVMVGFLLGMCYAYDGKWTGDEIQKINRNISFATYIRHKKSDFAEYFDTHCIMEKRTEEIFVKDMENVVQAMGKYMIGALQ